MTGLSDVRRDALLGLIRTIPDGALADLGAVLHADDGRGLGEVRGLVEEEAASRDAARAAFLPLAPLYAPGRASGVLRLPPQTPAWLWRAALDRAPEQVRAASHAAESYAPDDSRAAEAYDDLCRTLAALLRGGAAPVAPFREACEAAGVELAALALLLELAPGLRSAAGQLALWLGHPTPEHATAARLAFRDASELDEAAGPVFIELLAAQLPHPWLVLRLISVVMGRPSDRYLAASELGRFGEALLDEIDAAIQQVRRFDPEAGAPAGREAAAAVEQAVAIAAEFEQSLLLDRRGPWGRRLMEARKALAYAVEARLREVEGAVDGALPTQGARLSGRLFRRAPRVKGAPDPARVRFAGAMLAFLAGVRHSAPVAGFGTLWGKVSGALDDRLYGYTEELLDLLHQAEASDQPAIQAYVAVAAEFTACVMDDSAAEVVRRRAAAA